LGGYIEGGRVQGILAVSRAFGDYKLSPYVISVPYIKSFDLSDLSSHLIIACDGVWDVLPDQMVASLIKNQPDPVKSSKLVRERALQSGSNDNISVIVIQLYPLIGQESTITPPLQKKKNNNNENRQNKKNKSNDFDNNDDLFDSEDDNNDNNNNENNSDDSVVIGDSDLDSEEVLRKLEEEKKKT